MLWQRLFATKSLETLHAEMEGDNRLRRVLGPVALTSLGVGAIIGAGIFVMTGRAAANDAGPAVLLSFAVAGVGCALAALCYAEFASLAPVAGSAYTYAYATLGELLAWVIGWDLVLEYAMSCATVAASWSKYLNEFLVICFGPQWRVPDYLCHDPFSHPGAWFNLPAVFILVTTTAVLVIGIRESAASNTALVVVKVGVVLFVIAVGAGYVNRANWTTVPVTERKTPVQREIKPAADAQAEAEDRLLRAARAWAGRFGPGELQAVVVADRSGRNAVLEPTPGGHDARTAQLYRQALAAYKLDQARELGAAELHAAEARYGPDLPQTAQDRAAVRAILAQAQEEGPRQALRSWGLLGHFGLNAQLARLDDAVRNPFMPYGLSGLMLGAAIVFFAFIGFDSISTHSEEARRPQRDVPIGILASLLVCTLLYVAVAAVITGMEPYPEIDPDAAVAAAFRKQAEATGSPLLRAAAGLIATGALAGMTSVILITFLSQARIFLAMARDRLIPPAVFGAVHEKFRTPHLSTLLTGSVISVVAAFTPILVLEEMVNIGTLFAFVVVCAAVLILRLKRPDAPRPFRCPAVFLVAPLGIAVNLLMMLFLPPETWYRLVVWLLLGLVFYFAYGYRQSTLGRQLRGLKPAAAKA